LADEKLPKEAPKEKEMKRLTAEEAEKLLIQHLKDKEDANIPGGLPLKELTTDAVWEKLKVQVFKLQHGKPLPRQSTYVIKQGKAIPIGMDFGGDGVNSLCVADLKGDGQPFLVFSYAWGSGIHRSQIGALDCLAKEPKVITAAQSLVLDFTHDWSVRALDKKTVRVEGGGVSFGNLELMEKDGKATLRLQLPDDLPAKIRKNVQ
jgi:hypothetical protein